MLICGESAATSFCVLSRYPSFSWITSLISPLIKTLKERRWRKVVRLERGSKRHPGLCTTSGFAAWPGQLSSQFLALKKQDCSWISSYSNKMVYYRVKKKGELRFYCLTTSRIVDLTATTRLAGSPGVGWEHRAGWEPSVLRDWGSDVSSYQR